MAGRVYVRDLEVLLNLQAELGKFNYGTNQVLADVGRGITDAKAFLNARTNHWNAELRRREGALRACLAAGDRSCRAEAAAVRQAQEALEKLRKLNSVLEQSAGEYQPHANRLQQVLNSKIGKANRDLQRSIDKYRQYLDQAKPGSSLPASAFNRPETDKAGHSSTADPSLPTGITWSEKEALLKKWLDNGITLDELERLNLPVSDLQAGSLAEEDSWIQKVIASKDYLEAARGSREAQDLKDAILDYIESINRKRS